MKRTVWWEPSKLVKGAGSLRYYDPISGKKAARVYCPDALTKRREKNRLENMLNNWTPSTFRAGLIPLVVFEDYLNKTCTKGLPLRESTKRMKRDSLTKFLESVFALDHITPDRIQSWATSLAVNYAVDSVSIKLRDMRSFVTWCTKQGLFKTSPFQGISIPASTFVGRRIKTGELQRLFKHAEGWIKDYLMLLYETGARKSELLEARSEELNLDDGYWIIPAARSKTKEARIIPLSPSALATFKRIVRHGLIFPGISKRYVQTEWDALKAKAGIEGRLRLHDWRHTAASEFKGRRASLKAIFGWKSDTMADRYSHTEIEELREDMMKGKNGADLGQP